VWITERQGPQAWASVLIALPAVVGPSAGYLTALCLGFLLCKLGHNLLPASESSLKQVA
jgi:hypothetical protein